MSQYRADVRFNCAALVAAHPDCFRGELIHVAAELADFVLEGKLPGGADNAPKMAMGQAAGATPHPNAAIAAAHASMMSGQAKASERPALSDAARAAIREKLVDHAHQLAAAERNAAERHALGDHQRDAAREWDHVAEVHRGVIAALQRDLGEPG